MFHNNENSNNDISPSKAIRLLVARHFKVFAENLVNIILREYLTFDGKLYRHRESMGLFNAKFNVQTRRAIIYLATLYRTEARKMFQKIAKENLGNILWFTDYVNKQRAALHDQALDYDKCFKFSVYLAGVATYLYEYGVEGILNIAAEHIAGMFNSVVHSDGMGTLEMIVQKYAAFHRKKKRRSQVRQLVSEEEDRSAIHTSDQDLNRSSRVIRLENEIVRQNQCQHINHNELMGGEKIKENLIPIQTFPFCGKSQTSSSEPTARQMHPDYAVWKNYFAFTVTPRTSRDTSVVADNTYFQSQSMLATTSAFKRRVSNESGESENNTAKKIKTDCTISNNKDAKNFRNISMEFNALSESDSD